MAEKVKKVTPRQFLDFTELSLKNIRRREEKERAQKMSEAEFRDWVLEKIEVKARG